jgi:hypothetical protein
MNQVICNVCYELVWYSHSRGARGSKFYKCAKCVRLEREQQ